MIGLLISLTAQLVVLFFRLSVWLIALGVRTVVLITALVNAAIDSRRA